MTGSIEIQELISFQNAKADHSKRPSSSGPDPLKHDKWEKMFQTELQIHGV